MISKAQLIKNEIKRVLASGSSARYSDLADAIEKKGLGHNRVGYRLTRMVRAGEIKRVARGEYRAK